ncbi:MAG TPA: MarR family transcriptional regulator [Gaiellaceae bacterium]|nr:MarR family transcriptional regulator [Gaiellaceae bacterium]
MGTSYRDAAAFRTELRRFLRRSEEAARQVGITPGQHVLLLQIAGSDDEQTTVSELVEKLSLTQSAVTELVQRAELAGLVARQTSAADGRVAHLRLTDLGADSLGRVHSALGPERAQLRRMIDRLEKS